MQLTAPLVLRSLAAIITVGWLGACSKPQTQDSKAVATGRQIYLANCASCHNTNPNLEGPTGPPIAGSSRELVEARVLHRTYPAGYHPKRSTHVMRPLPWLAPNIGDLVAFLASAKQPQQASAKQAQK